MITLKYNKNVIFDMLHCNYKAVPDIAEDYEACFVMM